MGNRAPGERVSSTFVIGGVESERRSAKAAAMRKVLVIGSSGAGKSVFAARLARRTGLPLIHLDAIYWRPGWVKTPKDEWTRTVDELLARDAWIIDGNYVGTLDRRLAACDTVVFLDLPRAVCLWRAVKRRIVFRGRARPDITTGCDERLTLEFIRWIWEYPEKRRPGVLAKLSALRPNQRAIVLRSTAEAEAFLRAI
jgi:adenylate kinase family enzyme